MNTLSTASWKRRGSTVLCGTIEIRELLDRHTMVSLREFLAWGDEIPDDPPGDGSTILVCGLDTVLDTLPAKEAEAFLRSKVRPVIKQVNNFWTETGIVFGFAERPELKETVGREEEVLLVRSDGQTIHLSEGLWDGTAALNMYRIETSFIDEKQKVRIGYHVQRIS